MKVIQAKLVLTAAISALLVFSLPLQAQENPIGSVVALRGDVTAVDRAGARRRLEVKSSIYLADTIKTGRRGRVQMMFDDNTLISLGPNTSLLLAEYRWDPDKKKGAMKTRVSEGVFRIMGGAITQTAPSNFKTETPAGIIGIRGSMYAGKVSGSALHLLFQGGKGIFVTNSAGTVAIDRPGFGTFVAGPTTPPTAPVRFSAKDLSMLEDVIPVSPADSNEEGGDNGDAQSQSPTGSGAGEGAADKSAAAHSAGPDSQPDGGEGQTEVQELWALQTLDEPAGGEESPLLDDAALIAELQSAAVGNPVDAVKDAASEAVVDGIQTTRQEAASQIEQIILDLLLEMGFVGERSVGVPDNGIGNFDGVVLHKDAESLTYSESPVKMAVNWYNKKFFGIADDDQPTENEIPVFIFGDINGTALDNIRVVGSDFDVPDNRVSALSGSGTFGQLYGTETEAAGFAMEGVDVNVQNQAERQGWTAYGAVIRKDNPSPPSPVPVGIQYLRGFVMGAAEDMAAPEINRRIFMNSQASDFQLNVNKDTGTINGSMSASDFNGSLSTIDNLQIGGSLASAYVLDDAMIALLGGAGSIRTGSSSGGLKEYGNYLVTQKQPDELAPYTTWGYWEIAYRDPASGLDYHVHHPGSIWIAGSPTPATDVSALISTNFSGTYTGGAQGIRIDPGGSISKLTGGAADLTIDFTPSATLPVTGQLSFDQVNLNVISNPGAISANGFNAQISGATASTVHGAFFGPNAQAIGGNFGARMSSGDGYYGIFAGGR